MVQSATLGFQKASDATDKEIRSTPPKLSGSSDEPMDTGAERATVLREEHAANLGRSALMWWISALGMVLLSLSELWGRGDEDLSVGRFWVPRAVLVLGLGGAGAWSHRTTTMTSAELRAFDAGMYALSAALIAFMTVENGGLGGPFFPAMACLIAAQGLALPDHWKRGAVRVSASLCAFGAASICASALLSSQEASGQSSLVLVQRLAVLATLGAIVVAGGHGSWAARRSVQTTRTAGRYVLKQRIGRGGMGEVWRARLPALRRDVAVKLVRSDLMTPQAIARFGREVAALAELRHPNTVRVLDWGAYDGTFYYAMELLSGETLASLVRRVGPLSPERAIHIVRQAAHALSEAHGRGIVHRDVKPDNLFLTRDEPDFLKVLDFGVAKSITPSVRESSITRIGMIIGTASYMAPEQVLTAPVDARTDVYALGAVLFFALTGRAPFLGTEQEVMRAQLRKKAPDVAEHSPHSIAPELAAVVQKCLEKQPRMRYGSAIELDLALAEVLRGSILRMVTPEGALLRAVH